MKIVVLLSRFPYPLEKGDKLRAFHQIKELSKSHQIILCALSDTRVKKEAVEILTQYCAEVQLIRLYKWKIYWNILFQFLFTNKSLQVAYFYNKQAQRKINTLLDKHQPDHIYCQLVRVAEYVKDAPFNKTLDYMDALARGMERRIENAPFYLRPFLKVESTRLKRYEHFIFNHFNHHIIISEQDKGLIVNINNDQIKVIPNGVDYTTYNYREEPKEYDIIFTGNMAYPPNVESAIYIVNNIMPLVWKKKPSVNLVIAGAEPDPKVLRLKSDKILITGWVDHIADYYAKSKVFVAPMEIGTGLQNKLLEAMAMKLPCITSELANNALGGSPGRHILLGKDAPEYASHIIDLLENEQLYSRISEQGYIFVKENYTWQGSTVMLEELLTSKNHG